MTTEDNTRNPPTHPIFLKAITLAQQWEAPVAWATVLLTRLPCRVNRRKAVNQVPA